MTELEQVKETLRNRLLHVVYVCSIKPISSDHIDEIVNNIFSDLKEILTDGV